MSKKVFCILSMLAFISIFLVSMPLAQAEEGQDKSEQIVNVGDIEKAPYLRLDFNLKGATCVACIRRVAKRLRDNKGVFKADISILQPYEGVVIFDPKKTSVAKLSSEITKEEKRAKAGEMQLTALSNIPSIVLPRAKNP